MSKPPRYPTHREPDRGPVLPFVPGEVSNGEFVPRAATARDRWIARETLARAGDAADRLGVDRRRFLQGAGGMAAILATVNLACANSQPSIPPIAGGTTGLNGTTSIAPEGTSTTVVGPGGTFEVKAPEDLVACDAIFGDRGEFIVDVHTHHVMPDGPWRQNAPAIRDMIGPLAPTSCRETDRLRCLDRTSYVQDMFLASDTALAILSDVPNSGPVDAPVPFAENLRTHEWVKSLAAPGGPRALVQSVIAPNFGPLHAYFDTMSEHARTGTLTSFKVYTAWGPNGRGYALDDPAIGLPVIEHARSLGVKVICAHKGLPIVGFDFTHNGPDDVVNVAKQYPDMNFVVYHSAFVRETTEGPYNAASAASGTNSLLKAMDDHGMPANSNVWCELGTTWRELMSNPTQAAHVLGKLLTRMGEDRVMWGTDAIWYGSPQPQIMAFRAFQITSEFQQRFGYPALTDEIKRKIFGLNAAKLFGLDPNMRLCEVSGDKLTQSKAEFRSLVSDGALTEPWRARAPLSRRDILTWLKASGDRWSPL